jgi:hypothetical protein
MKDFFGISSFQMVISRVSESTVGSLSKATLSSKDHALEVLF